VNVNQPCRKIGHQMFGDCVPREEFEDCEGRRFVLSDPDERLCGQWLPPADEPHIA
jgi:hypothetical protein